MPLHLLGKKSWNVYNADNIARVKADEAAAAAREEAEEQRMQELDAARRAAILRGETPPPLPEEDTPRDGKRREDKKNGRDRKRRKLAGEDDTDRDIRLASTTTAPRDGEDNDARVLKLRKPSEDAPLMDHAGNINLFPVDLKEAMKREKNEEAEKEKRKKERALEDQYTMRFSNAAGKEGLERPWYASGREKAADSETATTNRTTEYSDFPNKDVWGNEDPLRKERELARVTSNDPFAFMQRAQVQLKKSKEDKKRWADERGRELRELRATQERDFRRERHKRKKRADEDQYEVPRGSETSSRHKHRHRNRSHSRERGHEHRSSHRHERKHSRTHAREHDRERGRERASDYNRRDR